MTTVEPEPLIPAGYEIAYDQFQLPIQAEKRIYKANGPALTTATSGDELTVSSSKVNFVFNKKSGLVTSYKVDGTEYFKDGFGIQPNFWRAPNDNDYGNGAPKRLQVWKQSSKNFHVTDVKMTTENKVVSLKATYLLAAGNLYVVTYRIYPSGIVNVSANSLLRICKQQKQKFPKLRVWLPLLPEAMLPAKQLPNWKFPVSVYASVCPPK